MITRRGFLQSMLAAGLGPAIVPYASLMRPRPLVRTHVWDVFCAAGFLQVMTAGGILLAEVPIKGWRVKDGIARATSSHGLVETSGTVGYFQILGPDHAPICRGPAGGPWSNEGLVVSSSQLVTGMTFNIHDLAFHLPAA